MDSDSEHEGYDDAEADLAGEPSEAGEDQDEDNMDIEDAADDDTDAEEGSGDDDSGDEDEEEDIDDDLFDAGDDDRDPLENGINSQSDHRSADRARPLTQREPSPIRRSLSPAHMRRAALYNAVPPARSYTIEPIAAIPHPVATHALASSLCFSHVLTGSQDGYIRDYDVFASCNGKTFLTAPQRHHCGLGDSAMRAGILRSWWESAPIPTASDSIAPVYSMAVHSDALWGLAGNAEGRISIFSIRHDPGRVIHIIEGHKQAVSAMCLAPDEKSAYSASWDNLAIQWDLNTGQSGRTFSGHTAQLTSIHVRPLGTAQPAQLQTDLDAKSDGSFDDLFDEDDSGPSHHESKTDTSSALSLPTAQRSLAIGRGIAPMSPVAYAEYSQDMILTASIDGQVILWDRRVRDRAGRLDMGDKCPPWCISTCWSIDGSQVYVGRRNGTIDVWDVRQLGLKSQSTPRVLKVLRNPPSSGAVSCVASFPDGHHIACASQDNIRLWNVHETEARPRGLGFKIIAGHHGGVVSQILIDRGCRFMVTASGDRGWFGDSTKTVLIHEIKRPQ